jgi:hypothetical protein
MPSADRTHTAHRRRTKLTACATAVCHGHVAAGSCASTTVLAASRCVQSCCENETHLQRGRVFRHSRRQAGEQQRTLCERRVRSARRGGEGGSGMQRPQAVVQLCRRCVRCQQAPCAMQTRRASSMESRLASEMNGHVCQPDRKGASRCKAGLLAPAVCHPGPHVLVGDQARKKDEKGRSARLTAAARRAPAQRPAATLAAAHLRLFWRRGCRGRRAQPGRPVAAAAAARRPKRLARRHRRLRASPRPWAASLRL